MTDKNAMPSIKTILKSHDCHTQDLELELLRYLNDFRLELLDELEAKHQQDIDKLKDILIHRDGGSHDTDCKIYKNLGCNCGHDMVVKIMQGVE